LEFKRSKKPELIGEWRENYEGIIKDYLSISIEIPLSAQEVDNLRSAVEKLIRKTPLEHGETKLMNKLFGFLIDGSRKSFVELAGEVEQRLGSFGVSLRDYPSDSSMKLLDCLAQKEEFFKTQVVPEIKSFTYFELKALEGFKNDEVLEGIYDVQSLRRKSIAKLEKLGALIKILEKSKDDRKSLDRIDEAEKKLNFAQGVINKEIASKSSLSGIKKKSEDLKKTLLSKENQDEKKTVKEMKSPLRTEPPAKKEQMIPEDREDAGVTKHVSKSMHHSAKESQPTESELSIYAKNNASLKSFFASRKVETKVGGSERDENSLLGSLQEENIWKKGLGSLVSTAIWTEDRQKDWEKTLISNSKSINTRKSAPNVKELLSGLVSRLKESKPRQLTLEEIKRQREQPRYVIIRYEDYLFDWILSKGIKVCNRGLFKKTSDRIKARNPLSRDDEALDYEVSTDEEGESIDSDEVDSNEDLDEVDPDDFVVPDGYFSDSELNDSIDEGERGRGRFIQPK
jgi:hypothetical protein